MQIIINNFNNANLQPIFSIMFSYEQMEKYISIEKKKNIKNV